METANDRPSRSMSSRGKFLIISYMLSNSTHLKATFSISFTRSPCTLATRCMYRYTSDQTLTLILFPHLKASIYVHMLYTLSVLKHRWTNSPKWKYFTNHLPLHWAVNRCKRINWASVQWFIHKVHISTSLMNVPKTAKEKEIKSLWIMEKSTTLFVSSMQNRFNNNKLCKMTRN